MDKETRNKFYIDLLEDERVVEIGPEKVIPDIKAEEIKLSKYVNNYNALIEYQKEKLEEKGFEINGEVKTVNLELEELLDLSYRVIMGRRSLGMVSLLNPLISALDNELDNYAFLYEQTKKHNGVSESLEEWWNQFFLIGFKTLSQMDDIESDEEALGLYHELNAMTYECINYHDIFMRLGTSWKDIHKFYGMEESLDKIKYEDTFDFITLYTIGRVFKQNAKITEYSFKINYKLLSGIFDAEKTEKEFFKDYLKERKKYGAVRIEKYH